MATDARLGAWRRVVVQSSMRTRGHTRRCVEGEARTCTTANVQFPLVCKFALHCHHTRKTHSFISASPSSSSRARPSAAPVSSSIGDAAPPPPPRLTGADVVNTYLVPARLEREAAQKMRVRYAPSAPVNVTNNTAVVQQLAAAMTSSHQHGTARHGTAQRRPSTHAAAHT